jgi:hypothetical protein
MKGFKIDGWQWLGYYDRHGKIYLVRRIGRVGDCVRP